HIDRGGTVHVDHRSGERITAELHAAHQPRGELGHKADRVGTIVLEVSGVSIGIVALEAVGHPDVVAPHVDVVAARCYKPGGYADHGDLLRAVGHHPVAGLMHTGQGHIARLDPQR